MKPQINPEIEYLINSIINRVRIQEKLKHTEDYKESKLKQNTIKQLEHQIYAKKYKIHKLYFQFHKYDNIEYR